MRFIHEADGYIDTLVKNKKKNLNNDTKDKYKHEILRNFKTTSQHIKNIYKNADAAYYHQALTFLYLRAINSEEAEGFKESNIKFKYMMRYMRNFAVRDEYKKLSRNLTEINKSLK